MLFGCLTVYFRYTIETWNWNLSVKQDNYEIGISNRFLFIMRMYLFLNEISFWISFDGSVLSYVLVIGTFVGFLHRCWFISFLCCRVLLQRERFSLIAVTTATPSSRELISRWCRTPSLCALRDECFTWVQTVRNQCRNGWQLWGTSYRLPFQAPGDRVSDGCGNDNVLSRGLVLFKSKHGWGPGSNGQLKLGWHRREFDFYFGIFMVILAIKRKCDIGCYDIGCVWL